MFFFFQFFGFKLIVIPPIHILLIVNICSFLNSDCPNAFSSKNCKQIKIVNIYIFLNSNCPHALNSKNIKTNSLDASNSKNIKTKFPNALNLKISKLTIFKPKLSRYPQFKKY